MEWIIILGLAYVVFASGALKGVGVPGPTSTLATTPATPAQSAQLVKTQTAAVANQQSLLNETAVGGIPAQTSVTGVHAMPLILSSAATIGTGAMTGATALASTSVAGISGAALGAATAGIGAVAAVAVALLMAHEQRVKEAKDENSAMNLGVSGFDSDLQMIQSYYNSRRIDAQGAIQNLTTAMAHYWQLVSPHIQPGRNGCASGVHCPPRPIKCAGSIGAVCCVGCDPLYLSLYDDGSPETDTAPQGPGVVTVLMQGGGVAQIKDVIGSKYGGKTRLGYKMTWKQTGAA